MGGLSHQDFPDHKTVGLPPVLHRWATIFLGGGDVGVAQEHLLCVNRCHGSAEKRPVGMPKGMPADASETHFRGELAARVVDGDGVSFSPAMLGILAGDSG